MIHLTDEQLTEVYKTLASDEYQAYYGMIFNNMALVKYCKITWERHHSPEFPNTTVQDMMNQPLLSKGGRMVDNSINDIWNSSIIAGFIAYSLCRLDYYDCEEGSPGCEPFDTWEVKFPYRRNYPHKDYPDH